MPEETRWSASAPSHSSLASPTIDAKGSVPRTPERCRLDVQPLAARLLGLAHHPPEVEHRLAYVAETGAAP